jgi:hypothetical protein
MYDDVGSGWKIPSGMSAVIGHSFSFTQRPSGHPKGPYWSFDGELNGTNGLKLTNVHIKELPGHHDGTASAPVFESIEFTDLKVFFADGTSEDFDIGPAFGDPLAIFETGEDGDYGMDDLFQRGVKLTLNQNVGGVCPILVELSVVFRGPGADFEPGGNMRAMKVYPQIGLTWLGGGSKRPISLRGAVRMIVAVESGAPSLNRASFFTDSNTARHDKREYGIKSAGEDFRPLTGPLSSITLSLMWFKKRRSSVYTAP